MLLELVSMDIDQYLSSPGALSVTELRLAMRALGYPVKSNTQIRQWRHQYKGRRPDPKNCTGLELATNGGILRVDVYTDDWHLIWPELAKKASKKKAQK